MSGRAWSLTKESSLSLTLSLFASKMRFSVGSLGSPPSVVTQLAQLYFDRLLVAEVAGKRLRIKKPCVLQPCAVLSDSLSSDTCP